MAKPPLGTLADRVTHVHVLSGLDRATLSRLAGLAPSHLGMIMRGHVQEPRGKSLRRIAAVVGTTTDWLLSGTGKAPTARTIRAALEAARARTDAERAA